MTDKILPYPKLPRGLDRRIVLTEREIAEMRDLRNAGYSSRCIAALYFVSKTIVLYWTNDDAYREGVNKKRYQLNKSRIKRDGGFKKQNDEAKKDSYKRGLKVSDAKRKYKGKATYKWKKSKLKYDPKFKEKTNQQALSLYHKKKIKR